VGAALVLEEVRQGCQAGQPSQLFVNEFEGLISSPV
jgi:hypothetical protein